MSRNPLYDSDESRRSPRSRSPRHKDPFGDDYRDRGAPLRANERRRSLSGTRPNNGAFGANRDNAMVRDVARDFLPREPPRGPKNFPDPLGPSNAYPPNGPRDFRGEPSYRGEYRGRRGRGRGIWREDRPDRDRDIERDFRGPRDDCGPYRDDRGRDRWNNSREDNFRSRRASSPQGRGRSPNRGLNNLDIERARRVSRDAPRSAQVSDDFRGYGGRGRGVRGRGRGCHFDDFYHGRNASPDSSFARRPQTSTTPPPPLPAFGSTSSSAAIPTAPKASIATNPMIPVAPKNASMSVITTSVPPKSHAAFSHAPLAGVSVPTGPRSERSYRPDATHVNRSNNTQTGPQWTSPEFAKRGLPKTDVKDDLSTKTPSPLEAHRFPKNLPTQADAKDRESSKSFSPAEHKSSPLRDTGGSKRSPVRGHSPQQASRRRAPVVGKRLTKPSACPTGKILEDVYDSDGSVDSIGRGEFFEDDIKKIEDELSQYPEEPDKIRISLSEISMLVKRKVPEDSQELAIWNAEIERHAAWKRAEFHLDLIAISPWRPRFGLETDWVRLLSLYEDSAVDGSLLAKHSLDPPGSIPNECVAAVPAVDNADFAIIKAHERADLMIEAPQQTMETAHPIVGTITPRDASESRVTGDAGSEPLNRPTSPGKGVSSATAEVSAADHSLTTIDFEMIAEPEKSTTAVIEGALVHDSDPYPQPKIEQHDDPEDEQSTAERREELQMVRRMMRTPPSADLLRLKIESPFLNDYFRDALLVTAKLRGVNGHVEDKLHSSAEKRTMDQEKERKLWRERYYQYRIWTGKSNDATCVKSRAAFAKAKEDAAAEQAIVKSSTPGPVAKPEPQKRTGRFATEYDLEKAIQDSMQDAAKTQKEEERVVRKETATAKEATIPDMRWDPDQWEANTFQDYTHLVPFDRAINILQCGEPIDNFTVDEDDLFLKAYLDFPKQWGKIAEALPERDYKACIQHYYIKKHSDNFKAQLKKKGKRRTRAPVVKGAKPKSNALIADIVSRDDGDDAQEENGGDQRRRLRRAAAPTWNFGTAAPSEAASPVPTPGRKTAVAPKAENGSDAPPARKRTKAVREKAPKQAKSSQLLAAAPTPTGRPMDSPPVQSSSNVGGQMGMNRFPASYDPAAQTSTVFPNSPFPSSGKNFPVSFEPLTQTFTTQPRLPSIPPSVLDPDRNQQTSSYWSVPEQTEFPDLLRYFGTDWNGIAKHMTSKTNTMVYTTVFRQWLTVPCDSNRSRCVTNIQTQVKNYYQRQVENNPQNGWRAIAQEADDKRGRGESTGPLPAPIIVPSKPRGHILASNPRTGLAMEGSESDNMPILGSKLPQGSPPQPAISRYTALAQAGPSRTPSQPATPASLLGKQSPREPRPIHGQNHAQHTPQQMQTQPSRGPRGPGPAMGLFLTDPQRPILQASNSYGQSLHSGQSTPNNAEPNHRAQQAAIAAEAERAQALAKLQEQGHRASVGPTQQKQEELEREQQQAIEIQRAQQARHQLKQEAEMPSLHQFEPYPTASPRLNPALQTRGDNTISFDSRRTIPPQQLYSTARSTQPSQPPRNLLTDSPIGNPELKPNLPSATLRAPGQESYNLPPQAHASARTPQPLPPQAATKKSNIMSLLNNDDPPEPPRSMPSHRLSEPSSMQVSHTPPPQQGHQARFLPHNVPQMTGQAPQQNLHALPQHQPQHAYGQHSAGSMHQHTSSIGQQPRSFTPNSFETLNYSSSNVPIQHQQQLSAASMYAQPARQSAALRREPPGNDMHAFGGGFARGTSQPQSQSSMRLKESPYSATPPSQASRQQAPSPLDQAAPSERDYYNRQQYLLNSHNAVASPQMGPAFGVQAQHQAPAHRQLAFGQAISHTASPPTQFASQHPLHTSRHNSFDGRDVRDGWFPPASTSAPSAQQGHSQAPQIHSAPLSLHQQQTYPPIMYDSQVERQRQDGYRRFQQDDYARRELEAQRDADARQEELTHRDDMRHRGEMARREENARRR